MATLQVTNPTLADHAKRMDPDGKIAMIVEILNETNEILEDMTFVEANSSTSHTSTVRTLIPAPTWRKMNEGVLPTKSTSRQVVDTLGNLEAYAEVDKDVADLNGNTAAFRMSEDRPHIEGMNQEMAATLIYGNENTAAEEFTGLAPRFAALGGNNDDNIIDHGGTGSDNTSIWLVVWSPNTVFGIYPKGKQAGLSHRDLGEVTIENTNGVTGALSQGYRSHYKWENGLVVKDWRFVVRICNIDVSDLLTVANTAALVTSMVRAEERIPNLGMGRPVWYMNKFTREALRIGRVEKGIAQVSEDKVEGKRQIQFSSLPIRRVDSILRTEARIV